MKNRLSLPTVLSRTHETVPRVLSIIFMFLILLSPRAFAKSGPYREFTAEWLHSHGYVVLRFDTYRTDWDPDIFLDPYSSQNYIKIVKLDADGKEVNGTEKTLANLFLKHRSKSEYHVIANNALFENCKNWTTLNDDRASVSNGDKTFKLGDGNYAYMRMYIPADYIISGFKVKLRFYYENTGKDAGYRRNEWTVSAYNANVSESEFETQQSEHPGYTRYRWLQAKTTPQQFLYFTDNEGKIVQQSADGKTKTDYLAVNDQYPHKVTYKKKSYQGTYIPLLQDSKDITPHFITSFNVGRELITSAKQLTSNCTDKESTLASMVDKNTDTFWHSDWHNGNVKNGTHYFDVDLRENVNQDLIVSLTRRATKNNHVTKLRVQGKQNDKWTDIADLNFPYGYFKESQDKNKETVMANIQLKGKTYRYLRFIIMGTTSGNGYGHIAEFQINLPRVDNRKNLNQAAGVRTIDQKSTYLKYYAWPNNLEASLDSVKGTVKLQWKSSDTGFEETDIVTNDKFEILRCWNDEKGSSHEENVCEKAHSKGSSYTFADNINNINISGGLTYKLRRTDTKDYWKWDYAVSKGLDYVTQLASIDSVRAFIDKENGKARITWKYTQGLWPDSMKVNIYSYNRNSVDGPDLLVSMTSSAAKKGYYIDKNFTTCISTQYYVKVDPGAQDFYYDKSTGKYVEPQMAAVGDPLLLTDIGEISNARASKGYYNDHIDISFDTKGSFDRYLITRSAYSSTMKNVTDVATLTNDNDLSTLTFSDSKNIVPGVYYTYNIKGQIECDGKIKESDILSVVGFATSTGVVYGQVNYTNGTAVPYATVYANSSDETKLSGKSISLPGSQDAYLRVDKKIELGKAYTIQAYVMPTSNGNIFNMGDDMSLSYKNGTYYFKASKAGKTANASHNTKNGNVFEHVTAVVSNDSLRIYVNGELRGRKAGAKCDSIIANATIGLGMRGLIDEVRLWNRALTDEEIGRDYNRYLNGGEDGLLAYWRFNDGIDGEFYDLAHDNGNIYHQYDGTFVNAKDADGKTIAEVRYCDTIPERGQLAFKDITDQQGNYTISGIPYSGDGTNYSLSVVKGTHEFTTGTNGTPTTTCHISQDDRTYKVDFTDKSSFTVSGYIYYAGGTVPSPGVMFKVDNVLQYDKDGDYITTEADGHFTISVPVGEHKVQAYLANHTFVGDGKIVNLDGTNRDYQQNVESLILYDNTHVRLIGRVAGGTIQEAYPVGHSLSTNNLGDDITVTLKLKTDANNKIASTPTDATIIHPTVLQLENLDAEDMPRTRMTTAESYIEITADKKTGEFIADVFPLDYIISSVTVSGHGNLLKTNENLDLRNVFTTQYSKNTNAIRDKNGSVLYSRLDSVAYNYSRLFIERVSPTIELLQLNSAGNRTQAYYGDETETITKSNGEDEDVVIYDADKGSYALGYPVFTTNKKYNMHVNVYEAYQYYHVNGGVETEGKIDRVPVEKGTLTFHNDLSRFSYVDTLSVDSTGQAEYTFTCDVPDVSAGGPVKKMFLQFDADDATTYWNSNNALEAIVLGSKDTGTRAITKGPDELSFILRDPPGSKSYAYIDRNFSTSSSSTYSLSIDNTGSETVKTTVGVESQQVTLQIVPTGTSTGATLKTVATNTYGWGFVHTEGGGTGSSRTTTETYTEGYKTSDDPNFVGADGDLFVGNSTNINYGPSINVRLIPRESFNAASMTKLAEPKDDSYDYYVIRDNGISFGLVYGTQFVYTQSHIINQLIPEIKQLRNTLIKPNTVKDDDAQALAQELDRQIYRSNVSSDSEQFGTKGSYTIFYPKWIRNGKEEITAETDSVNMLNESVDLWEQYLSQNEEEKVKAKKLDVDGNVSLSGGASKSQSYKYSTAYTSNRTFSFTVGFDNSDDVNLSFAGNGSRIVINEKVTTTQNWNWKDGNDYAVTAGYVMSEPDGGDYVAVDVCQYKPWDYFSDEDKEEIERQLYSESSYDKQLEKFTKMAGSYIFRTTAGQTKNPWEGEYKTKYYQPGTILDVATAKQEDPTITIDKASLSQVPADGKATFTITVSNGECSQNAATFNLYLDPSSNPYGAVVRYGGEPLSSLRTVMVKANEALKQEITVERGSAFDYNDLRLILASTSDSKLKSEIPFSVRFQRTAGTINIDSPSENWVLNTSNDYINQQGEYELPVTITDFDVNQKGFHHVALEYKPSKATEKEWITVCRFYASDSLYNKDTGTKARIPSTGKLTYNMNMQTFSDRGYDLRTACVAILNGEENTTYSPVVSGLKDTTRPSLYGSVKPEDNVLDYGENVEMIFNEDISSGTVTANNFEVTGTQSTDSLMRNASIRFDGVNDCLVTEAETNLSDRDFTVESSIYIDSLCHDATFFSFGAPGKSFEIGMNTNRKLTIKCGDIMYTSEKAIDIQKGEWEHIGAIYTDNNHTVNVYYNCSPVWTVQMRQKPEAKGIFTIGLNADGKNGFCGKMAEFRIWNTACSQTDFNNYRNKTINANKPGLLSYYPMDDGYGLFVTDKSRGVNAVMCDAEWFVNRSGRAAKLTTDSLPALEISTGGIPLTTADDFTLEFWFRGAKGQKNVALFSNGQAENEPDAEDHITIGFNKEGRLHVKTSKTDHVSDLTSEALLNDAWHHLAFVVERSAGTAKLYVDGAFDSHFDGSKVYTLSSSYATIGCRTNIPSVEGQIDRSIYTYDQALDGSVDEIRLWSLAKNAEMISEQYNKALAGDERWLLAYYPFEQYLDNQGTQEMVYTLNDISATGKASGTIARGTAMETKDTAPVQEAGAVKRIEVNWTAQSDRMIIERKSGNWNDFNQSTVTYKVFDIYDKNGNVIENPIIYSAYIDQCPLQWSEKEVNIVIPQGEEGEFTVDISNPYGLKQKYSIENQPSWLYVSSTGGTLKPRNSEHIKFTVDKSVSVGRYTETIYLVTSDGLSRKLLVNIVVKGDEPDWNVNAGKYAFSMNIIGQIKTDGSYSLDNEDIIAAFSGDECIGVATNNYNANKGMYYTFLTVYGNDAVGTEPLTFRVWDASTGRTIIVVPDSANIMFKSDKVKGSVKSPVVFAKSDKVRERYAITSGWNWVSFNLMSNDKTVVSVLDNGDWASGDEIKNDKYTDSYSAVRKAWMGTLSTMEGMNNTQLFKLRTKNAQTVTIEGKPVDVTQTAITVRKNWNYIGYLPTTTMTLKDALAGYDASVGDIIKSQTGFAQYDGGNGWVGNMDYMAPGKGYMLMRTADEETQFRYPSVASTSSTEDKSLDGGTTESGSHAYASNMSIIASIEGITVNDSDNIVAYINGERCSNASKVAHGNSSLWFITVEGENNATVTFTLERGGKAIATAQTSMVFRSDAVNGCLDSPAVISFGASESDSTSQDSETTASGDSMSGADNGTGSAGTDEKPAWAVGTASGYEHSMSVWLSIPGSSKDDELAVFCGDECRGVGTLVSDDGTLQLWCVLVYGKNDDTTKLTMKFWESSASKILVSENTFPFTAEGQYGTVDEPMSFGTARD